MNIRRISILIPIAALAALVLAGGLYAARDLKEHDGHVDHALKNQHDHQDHADQEEETHAGEKFDSEDGHGHDHGTDLSDLDRSVEEMWTDICEHEIPTHQCEECRYEIGTVKLDAVLLGEQGLVRTGFPEKRQGRLEERNLPGEVQLDETRTVHVASPLTGMITRGFTAPGDRVEISAPLFEVDSPEVAEAKGAYLKAVAAHSLAEKTAEREALLFERKVAARVEVQEAAARRAETEIEMAAARGRLQRLGLAGEEIDNLLTRNSGTALTGLVTVRAAIAGTVIEGHASPGEYVETGKELLTISDLGRVWVLADVKEADLAAANAVAGGEAAIEAMGREFTGRLAAITGRISEETRTAKARFSVDNSAGLLRPGMFVAVKLSLPGGGETLAVPKVAVLADEGRTFVFVHKEGDYWIRRPVTLGSRFDGMVEVVGGLQEKQRIITDGSFLLKSDVLRSKMGAGCAD
ncbi:MAG: efflux RND transporter periplasmic adaptor subunit [Desulfobulbus sp.]|nr:MAG: efflux RND transporter periplasmic adaptor subunit [Desulfobulbus sp.]